MPYQNTLLAMQPRREPIRAAAQEGIFRLALLVLFDVAAYLRLHDPINRLLGPPLGPFDLTLLDKEVRQAGGVRDQYGRTDCGKSILYNKLVLIQ